MKILVTNHALNHYGGTETFVYALAVELTRMGHEVVCWSPRLGAVAQRLVAAGVAVTADLATAPDVDVIHAHHRYESLLARARYPDRPMIFACHGILPWQEQPAAGALDASRYVAVSEEVRDHLIEGYGVPADQVAIVRNGIDLERFRSRTPISARPQRALILSNYMPPRQRTQVRRVCQQLGMTVRETGAGNATWAVEDEIAHVDLVFGLGRSALEAMASKRVVLVYDYNGGDGLVTPDRFEGLRRRNFSGRTHRRQFSDAELAAEIQAYRPEIAEAVHAFIARDHDVRVMARQLVEIYEDARRRPAAGPASLGTGTSSHYRALTAVMEEAAALRATANDAQRSLRELRESRSWRALDMYRRLRWGIRRLHRSRGPERRAARILIVDDDPLFCQWLIDVLEADGHRVEAVGSGRAALERLREGGFDLVVSDLRMPDLDGIELYQELERSQPGLAQRVIFVTGKGADPRYHGFLTQLPDRYLAKPFDINQLTRLVYTRLGLASG